MPTILVIFGATGDLAARKLIPALYNLYRDEKLPSFLRIVGFSRQELSDQDFQERVLHNIASGRSGTAEDKKEFAKLFSYCAGIFEDPAGYDKIAEMLGRQDRQWRTCANKLFYLAVPPQYYETIFQNLASSGLTEPCSPEEGWTRVVVEKPFGKDLATAQELDKMLGQLFKEEQIYRIDHYLGKDTVQNILAFRFSNSFLDPSWNARWLDNIHIRFLEKEGLKGRGEFYDGLGALRDVGQNHMLQMLALITMENPGRFDADAIRRERTKVLESLDIMDQHDVARQTVRGQYAGYTSVKDVQPHSQTETYFRLQAHIHTTRWHGMPIYLEGGKGLHRSEVEITVTFRHELPCLCPPEVDKHYVNVLRYRIQPEEGIYTSFWVKKPGTKMIIEQKDFAFDYHRAFEQEEFIDAYSKLLLDVMAGDQTLFVSTDEIMASWKFIDPIIRAWEAKVTSLHVYEQGSAGPPWPPRTDPSLVPPKHIGYVGLGKMGANMVSRLRDHGWDITATDPKATVRASAKKQGARVVSNISQLPASLPAPRVVWLMVPHLVVDTVLGELVPHLTAGDIVIDGGNSFYKESVRRYKELKRKGIALLDVGVSGGPSGARMGACLMIGGDEEVYKRLTGLFNDLSSAGGYGYMGPAGAGHFVKMVHNGIEYGMMQALAEGFTVLKNWKVPGQQGLGSELDVERIASLYNRGSVIESRLIGWLKRAYEEYGPNLEHISGTVSHSGEGEWTIQTAKELGIPVPIIKQALQFRVHSQEHPSYTGQILSALRNQFGGHEVKKSDQ